MDFKIIKLIYVHISVKIYNWEYSSFNIICSQESQWKKLTISNALNIECDFKGVPENVMKKITRQYWTHYLNRKLLMT